MHEAIAQQVQELREFFQTQKLPKSVQLSPAEKIVDLPRFLDSHFTMLETHNDPRNYEVFLLRLEKLRNVLANSNFNDHSTELAPGSGTGQAPPAR